MNALDILKYGNLTFLRSVEAVSEADRNTPGVCGIWSVKDIIAHLASYELLLVDVLSGFLEGGAAPTLDRYLSEGVAFNDNQVEQRRGLSAGEALAEYLEVHERVMALAARIPAERRQQPGTLPWYGAEYSLDDLIVYQHYGHKREHSAQIAVFLDVLARRGGA